MHARQLPPRGRNYNYAQTYKNRKRLDGSANSITGSTEDCSAKKVGFDFISVVARTPGSTNPAYNLKRARCGERAHIRFGALVAPCARCPQRARLRSSRTGARAILPNRALSPQCSSNEQSHHVCNSRLTPSHHLAGRLSWPNAESRPPTFSRKLRHATRSRMPSWSGR